MPKNADKSQLRLYYRQKRNIFTGTKKAKADSSIARKIIDLPIFQKSTTIGVYVSIPEEVDTHGLLIYGFNTDKTIAVPKILPRPIMTFFKIGSFDDLKTHPFGILEPNEGLAEVPINQIELVVVPGIAFDRKGYRLGYGGGYTDWLFSQSSAYKIGIAYSFQVVEKLPRKTYDRPVDLVITEKELIECIK